MLTFTQTLLTIVIASDNLIFRLDCFLRLGRLLKLYQGVDSVRRRRSTRGPLHAGHTTGWSSTEGSAPHVVLLHGVWSHFIFYYADIHLILMAYCSPKVQAIERGACRVPGSCHHYHSSRRGERPLLERVRCHTPCWSRVCVCMSCCC